MPANFSPAHGIPHGILPGLDVFFNVTNVTAEPFWVNSSALVNEIIEFPKKCGANMTKYLHKDHVKTDVEIFLSYLFAGKVIVVKFSKVSGQIVNRRITINPKYNAPEEVYLKENINSRGLCKVWDIKNERVISFYLDRIIEWRCW